MKGLVFELSIPKYAVAKAVGRFAPKVHYGRGSSLSLRDVASPKAPGPEWVRLKPLLTGLCGSDLATIFFKASPLLEPFNSFPAVLGHEILAEVVETHDGARLEKGERVAVNPLLPCRLRGIAEPCRSCREGQENGCENTAMGHFAPGLMLGFHKELPGGIGEELVAHHSQLYRIPPSVTDEAAALIEPLSVSLHAVLKNEPKKSDRVLIVGGGPVGFATLWALRAIGCEAQVTLMTIEGYQLELAKNFGANEAVRVKPDKEEAAEVARLTGAKVYQPLIGPPSLSGGFDVIFDCAGTKSSVDDSIRYLRPFGKLVLIGAAGKLPEIDWTPVWKNELTIQGSYTYGMEEFRGRRAHTFELVRELLEKRTGPDVQALVTHKFPLEEYGRAIEANIARGKFKSVKTLFDLRRNRG